MKHVFKKISYHSTGEKEIAIFLDKMGITFEYEFPIAVIDGDGKTKIWYPDFYLKEYQMVIEYFGMYDHNESYRDNAEHKKEVYKNCGIQYIAIYNIKTEKWQEYLLNSIFTYLDYKRNAISKKIDKLQKDQKVKSIFQKFIPKIFKKSEPEKKYNHRPKKNNFSPKKANNSKRPPINKVNNSKNNR